MAEAVDFDRVIANAKKEGIPLSEIAIKYEGLEAEELVKLASHQEVTENMGSGSALAKFPLDGRPLFEEKAMAVLYLGA